MKTLQLMEEEADKDVWELFKSLMEGYSDSVIPLLSDLQTENNNNVINDDSTHQIRNNQQISLKACSSRKKAKTEASSSVPVEIMKERGRREKMTDKFSVLQSMLPNIPSKAKRTQIVDETIDYIKKLEEEVKGLEAKKKSAMELSSSAKSLSTLVIPLHSNPLHQNSDVNVTVSGNVAFFGIRTEVYHQWFLFSRVMKVFEKYKTEILTTSVTINEQKKITLSVTALVNSNGGGSIEAIKGDLITLFCLLKI